MIGAIVSFVCIDLVCLSYSVFVYDYSSQHVCRFTIQTWFDQALAGERLLRIFKTFSLFHSSTALHTSYSELDHFSVLDFQCWYLLLAQVLVSYGDSSCTVKYCMPSVYCLVLPAGILTLIVLCYCQEGQVLCSCHFYW